MYFLQIRLYSVIYSLFSRCGEKGRCKCISVKFEMCKSLANCVRFGCSMHENWSLSVRLSISAHSTQSRVHKKVLVMETSTHPSGRATAFTLV